MGVRLWPKQLPVLVGSGLMLLALSGCIANRPAVGDQQVEVFEFEIQLPDLDGRQAAGRVESMGLGQTVDARHVGWVEGPGGRADVVLHRVIDRESGPDPLFCRTVVDSSDAISTCGDPDRFEVRAPGLNPIQGSGGGGSDEWWLTEFTVSAEVVEVVGTTADGVTYTATPRVGFGYVEWPTRRGDLDMIAFDADGNELGRYRTDIP